MRILCACVRKYVHVSIEASVIAKATGSWMRPLQYASNRQLRRKVAGSRVRGGGGGLCRRQVSTLGIL